MNVKAYFDRIGLPVPEKIVPDSELLRKLQFAHCTTVPYENLDMIRDVPTSLEADALFEKIVVFLGGNTHPEDLLTQLTRPMIMKTISAMRSRLTMRRRTQSSVVKFASCCLMISILMGKFRR